jgi:hypothetical protein
MHLKGLSRETLNIEQAKYICSHFSEAISKAGGVFNVQKDHLKVGVCTLTSYSRAQGTAFMADVLCLMKSAFVDLDEINMLYEQFYVSSNEFKILIENGSSNWRRYFNFSDPSLVASNYANYFSALFNCNINRQELQNKLSRHISGNFGILDLSAPGFTSIGVLIGLNNLGILSQGNDIYGTEEIASHLSCYHEINRFVFCEKGISHKIIKSREDEFYYLDTAPEYWCEINKYISDEEYKGGLSTNRLAEEAIRHFRLIDSAFGVKLEAFLIGSDIKCAIELRDLINALYIAWEFKYNYPDYTLPTPAQRRLGAHFEKCDREAFVDVIPRNARSGHGKKVDKEMPVWTRFIGSELVTADEHEVKLISIFRRLPQSKQMYLLRSANELLNI